MEQHNGGSRRITTVEIVESHTVALGKATNGWVIPFRENRERNVPEHQKNEGDYNNDRDGFSSGHSLNLMARVQSNSRAGLPHVKEPACALTRTWSGCSVRRSAVALNRRLGTNLRISA